MRGSPVNLVDSPVDLGDSPVDLADLGLSALNRPLADWRVRWISSSGGGSGGSAGLALETAGSAAGFLDSRLASGCLGGSGIAGKSGIAGSSESSAENAKNSSS